MSVRSPTVYSTNYSKRGDRKWYGYIKDRYRRADTKVVPGGFRMLLPGDSLFPGLRDLTVAVPSDLAKYLKKVTDHCGDDSRDKILAIQRAFEECLGQSSEETITRYVLLDVDEDMEKILRYDGGVSECDNLGPAFSKNIFAAKVFRKWEPKLTSVSRMANGHTKVAFYDIEELALATVVIPAAASCD